VRATRGTSRGRLKKLEDSIKKKQDKAAKLEKSVENEEEALKNKVVAAKKEREQGNKLERRARGKVHDVDKMRDEAVKLEKEAQAARSKFLAAEKPVELATKLATHDHKVYRKAELAVAKEVVQLSERPNDSKLHAEVDKLVKKSKNAKAKMEGDGTMLKTLENRAGDSKFDGEWSYSRLSQKSVDVAKDAKHLARHAERQAEEGHKDREEAAKEVKDVEQKMKGPERAHKEADKLRADYRSEEKKLSKLRGELDETPAHKDGGSSYSKDRAALKKLVNGGGSSSSSSDAEAQYDQLEASDEAKERKAAKLSGHWGSGSSTSSSSGADAAKRANIIKSSQSTFLTGLLSPNSPWDKKDVGS